MPPTLTYSHIPHASATARTQLATRRYAQSVETRPVPPLKGLGKTRAASVSYRASVPAGHAYCEVAPSHRASAPAADRQNGSFKALSGKGSAPTTPPPFRHTPGQSRPRHTATVWRNLEQHPHRDGTYTFSAKEKDVETGLSYFGSRYYNSDLSIWLSVDPQAAKYPSLSPYVYCANSPVKLVDPNGEEIGEPPLKRIVNLGFQSKTFRKLFRKSGLTIENMSDIISFGNQSFMNPYTKKITLRDANSDMGNVIALTHEMTNRINAKKLKNNMESVRKGDISYETFADNAIRIESEGVANQIIVASELNYSFPDDKGVMNDLKTQYKEGTIRRREMLNVIQEGDFQNEFGGDAKKDYYEQGKNIRESQIRRERQRKSGF